LPNRRGLYYIGHPKAMGKRELLLVSGFAVIGVLVYQLTMPASADTGGGFSAWWARVRSHLTEHWVEKRYERKAEVPVPAEVKTLAIDFNRANATVVGEARETVVVDVSGVVFGGDEAQAQEFERQLGLKVEPDGPVMRVTLTLPKRDELTRRPTRQFTIRVPARLGVEARLGGGELSIQQVASVHLPTASGNVRLEGITGKVTGELERGMLDVEDVGSVAMKIRRCEARLQGISGALEIDARGCELRARRVGGPTTLEIEDVEGELEDAAGPVRLTGKGGAFHLRAVRSAIEATTDRTTLYLLPGEAVPITASVERDTLEITLPRGGVIVDATATNGDVRAPEGLLTVTRDEDVVKASGAVRGGGPRVQLRTTRGDIVVR
jgi:hypothetical protein